MLKVHGVGAVSKPTASKDGALRTIIALKALGGVLFLLIGLGVLTLVNHDIADLAEDVADSLGVDPENLYLLQFLEWLIGISSKQIIAIGFVTLLYSALLLTMAWGLHVGRVWADWLTIGATGLFIPVELYEVVWSIRPTYSIALAINIFIVWYLIRRRIRSSSL
ncbi:membrane protein [Candidatus Methylomirabilis lanthanidiphila]|uniref:Membrane protein n=1 Tax=Candidatus Methylomirabilis lanthanidiphila TaxID=2211376 RepID=A0A564ZIL3_9BACT|nr:DUF2127 domain-containing protein [Candidatus Methylomirabilis lanthanidiphila]VUZ85190.1 membrane protein [Candidatus Methylomirabilis lanthanidiphila]